MLVVFFRKDMFYPLDLADDVDVKANAECNPGTLRVECALTGRVIWQAPEGTCKNMDE